ncbi:MAG TPA: hypothetical protein VG367_07765 [Mucilaginibacter sp.]|jgi:hypothetical protein|nr:hypothetical protein [Mucilaginibacter sp.]
MSAKREHTRFDNDDDDRDSYLKNNLGEESDAENLAFNEDEDSYEYDVDSDDPDYEHPDPYNTAAKNGEDMNSTYDEANPYDTADEYIPNESLETDAEELGMHIAGEEEVEVDPIDDILSRTDEDNRPDLDEEGYPINDRPKHK